MTTFCVRNPFTDAVLREVPFTTEAEAMGAVEAAKGGLRRQAELAAFERADILLELARLVEAHHEALAELIVEEVGKTLRDSRLEVKRSVQTLVASAEESRRVDGETLTTDAYPPKRGKRAIVEWRPIGIVLAIVPFNFPLNITAHKVGPAFAAGNAVLLKPPLQGHAVTQQFVELCHQAGMPEDVLQLVTPDVPVVQRLVEHPEVGCVNFTGSVPVGQDIARRAGMKRLLLELGGNDPLIVMEDADVEAAADVAVEQRFGTAGQRCTAVKRAFVHPDVHDTFIEAVVARARELVVGDPSREETDVGPLVDAQAATKVEDAIGEAVRGGARVAIGNSRHGNVVAPTVLTHVPTDAPMAANEVFGPVLPVWTFDSLDALVETVNAQPLGLQAGVFTNDLRVVDALYERLDVGALVVNGGPGFRAEHLPFGGVKHSGLGREGVRYAIREMSYRKTLIQ